MLEIGILCFGAFFLSYVVSRFVRTERVPLVALGVGLGLPALLYSTIWHHVFSEDALAALGATFATVLAAVCAIIGAAIVFFSRER